MASPSHASPMEAWQACEASSDCVVDEAACYRPLAIHKKFLLQNQERNKKIRPVIKCSRYEGPPKESLRAICKEKKCVLEPK